MAHRFVIPIASLDPVTLENLVSEFVTRDGTDYGAVETSQRQRIDQLMAKLDRGEAVLLFDNELETYDILAKEMAGEWLQANE